MNLWEERHSYSASKQKQNTTKAEFFKLRFFYFHIPQKKRIFATGNNAFGRCFRLTIK
jgi:hypothetical protein